MDIKRLNMTFYNTNNESGQELQSSTTKAKHQEEIILEYFKLHPDKEFTPFEVQEAIGLVKVPITSIRRAMTNLCSDDKLIKTDNQREGQYGKKNYCWKLNTGLIQKINNQKKSQTDRLSRISRRIKMNREEESIDNKQQKLF